MKKKLTLLILMMSFSMIYSQNRHQERAETYLSNKGEITFSFEVNSLEEIKDFSNQLSIVNVDKESKTVKAWANNEQFDTFLRLNIPFEVDPIDNEALDVQMTSSGNQRANTLTFPLTAYPTYADYAQQMADFAADNPSICELVDIGGTGEGVGGGNKRLLFIKLSDNVSTQEQEPRVMYTSSMHGDEIAGYPMMLNLIDYFITAYNDVGHSDHIRVKNLLDTSEVWINPSANPDGTYYNSASNTSVANARRGNVNGLDLNRNYPDPSGVLHPDGQAYQVETLNFMALAESKHFVISANFHGGTEVVNYPWDYTFDRHPDDDWWIHICSEYANNVQADGASNGFPNYFTDINNNGITHGADWYLVNGGRQDYMNFENQAKETTIELSNIKTPSASLLDDYWFSNKEGLIEYLIQGTYGFRGVVKDAVTGNPIEATVKMVGHDDLGSWAKTELPLGDYYRPIKAGTYDIIFESPCYQSVTLTGQTISDYQTLTLADIMLTPIGAVAPTGLAASSINATTATLSWDAISGSTYDLRYREVGSPTWIVNAETNSNSSLTGLTASTDYEAQVRSKCTGGANSAYSNSVNFTTTDVQLNYCASASTNINDEFIGRVQLNTIDNSSGGQFYTDFTNISTTLTKDTQYTITVTPTWTGTVYNEAYSVWIDYNRDGDFGDAGEQVWTQGNTQATSVSGSFTIPSSAVENSTRMRVSMKYNGIPTSCETFQYGEVEDYTVIVESNAPDITVPVITLIGNSVIDLDLGDSYTELGATATDDTDGNITANIVTAGDTVNTSIAGTYVVTFNVSDAAGNNAIEVTRTVNVIPDTTVPVITLIGSSVINLDVGDTYSELGATASDNIDGDISGSIIVGGDVVNTTVGGTYVVSYNVNDLAGNPAVEVIRTVNVIPDTTIPVITLNGASTINLNIGENYIEAGATATDNIDGDITVNINIGGDTVDTNSPGVYLVAYNVSDAAGNNAVEVTRTVNVIPDTTIPIITLIGSSTINLDVGDFYTEQGATATDNIDGDISGSIVIAGDVVNTSIAGAYIVTYNVSDAAGNSATEVTRTVNVIPDTTVPVITLNGNSTIELDVDGSYTEQGATATDNIDGDISGSIVIAGDVVNTAVAGTYVVTYNVSDAAGNNAVEVIRTVNVIPDVTVPIITLNGASIINLNVDDVFTELGAIATDNIDGDISGSIVIAGDMVNTSIAGAYVVSYNVSDAAGNPATEVTRTVNVIPDTTIPVITLNGSSTTNLNVGDTYTELGATATDNIDGDITANIVTAGDAVDTNIAGAYVVTYNVNDAAGNPAAEVTRTVNVIPDTTVPVITLNGASTINLNVGDAYSELGATATDNIDGDITANIVTAGDIVDTNAAGAYVVTYNVSDAAGNPAAEVTRTVNVIPDTTIPVITLTGSSTIDLDVGGTYTEQGATATDNIDGDITANIVTAGDTVDTNVAGVYVVTYNVSDAAGNNAVEVTRTVNINEVANGCSGGISSFPYNEGFEGSIGAWSQSSADDLDWTVRSGTTPSANTGPSNATQGSNYIYVEASGNGTGYPDKRAIITSPCFDLGSLPEATFSFEYHMYGAADMGTIDLEVSDDEGATWTSIWSQSGNQGNSWLTVDINLVSYLGSGVQLRFNRFVGSTWQADIALDNINLTGPAAPDTQAPTSATLSASNTTQTTTDLSWSGATDNVAVTDYDVYQDGVFVTNVLSNSYQVTGLTASTTYGFYVIANDAAGNSSGTSNTVNITTDAIPTCSDGIQNGDETGIDCGGSTCDPCSTSNVTLHEGYFETGWDGWIDGGSDASRYSGSNSYEGSYSIRIRDNSNSSTMTLSNIDVTPYSHVEVDFHFYVNSMENGEDFWLQFYDGSSYTTVQSWVRGSGIENGNFYQGTVIIDASQYNFAANSGFRFRCDASGNNDQIYIDQVTITGISGAAALIENNPAIVDGPQSINGSSTSKFNNGFIKIYPNPVRGNVLNVKTNYDTSNYEIFNVAGQLVGKGKLVNDNLDISNLEIGVYLIRFIADGETIIKRFIKQ